jgi:hypothetical protein
MKLLLEADRQHLDVDTSLSELREPELPEVLPLTSPIKVVDEQNEIVVCIDDNGAAVQVFGSHRIPIRARNGRCLPLRRRRWSG